jgi:2-haloalkanoic acid dehalogenase type II
MTPRALVFDVFGTLVDWRSGVADAFRASGVSGEPHELADAWRARYWPMLAQVNSGAQPWQNFDEHHRATLDDLLGERGAALDVEQRRQLVYAWHRLDPWPDVRSGLEALRRGRVTATLSNAHVALLVDLARHGDLRFDCLLSAELARVYIRRRSSTKPPRACWASSLPSSCWWRRTRWTSEARARLDCRPRSSTGRSSSARAHQLEKIPRPTCLSRTWSSWRSGCKAEPTAAIDGSPACGYQPRGDSARPSTYSNTLLMRSAAKVNVMQASIA